ncbi:hypothetical protein [Caproicibacterium lactatifermentans]|uniref:Uncharacterized protein n=1 Tax=Caproicibacterium lactatifermentans TaxID=2666138 RepID=A0A859DPK2_9FIRM|nr:hypothetical protein [Caproicibacterium lactatifermentans]QKN23474.1 hypothetical protein GJQ69_02595 [Caproicibacterium lactatifermentans]
MRASFINSLFDPFDFMIAQIIHHDDAAFMESRRGIDPYPEIWTVID